MAKKNPTRSVTGRPGKSSTGRGSASVRTAGKSGTAARGARPGTSDVGARHTKATKGKVGGSAKEAAKFGGKLDFGVPPAKARPGDRRVKTKADTPSARAGREGQRVVGVGAYGDTPGKSGGEADVDILGIGTQGGSSVSTEGTLGRKRGKDLTSEGGSTPFAAGRPAKGRKQSDVAGKVGGSKRVRGTTHNAGQDISGGGGGTGTGSTSDLARDDRRTDKTVNPLTGGPAHRILADDKS